MAVFCRGGGALKKEGFLAKGCLVPSLPSRDNGREGDKGGLPILGSEIENPPKLEKKNAKSTEIKCMLGF